MTQVEVEGTTWPVDDQDVEWKFRYVFHNTTHSDAMLAASIMAAYRHLTDPLVDDEDAQEALRRARAGVQAVRDQEAERLASEVTREWTLEVVNEDDGESTRYLLGPYSRSDAEAKAEAHRKAKPTDKVALIRMQS